jgi:hypothetical protein
MIWERRTNNSRDDSGQTYSTDISGHRQFVSGEQEGGICTATSIPSKAQQLEITIIQLRHISTVSSS